MGLLHHSLILISPFLSIKPLQVSTGEAGEGDGEEYSLCFTLLLPQETNYAIFVKSISPPSPLWAPDIPFS